MREAKGLANPQARFLWLTRYMKVGKGGKPEDACRHAHTDEKEGGICLLQYKARVQGQSQLASMTPRGASLPPRPFAESTSRCT